MPTKAKKKQTQTDYVACRVQLTTQGVKLDFKPPWANGAGKHHYDRAGYELLVGGKRPANGGGAGGGSPKLPNGRFNRKEHTHVLSKDRPTRLAFYLDDGTSWRFVKKGVEGKTAADKARFTAHAVAPSGKVAEVTFRPEGKAKDYGYELWLQADVVSVNQANTEDRPSVTIIIDPVVRGGGIPPGP